MEQVKHASRGELVNELYKNLSLQAQNPDKIVETRVEISFDQMPEEINEEIVDTINTKLDQGVITNCLFRKNGKELFKGTKDDGRAHLMMQFKVNFKSEAYKKFQALDFYDDFTDREDDVFQVLSIDCGDNAKQAAKIYTSVLTNVFGVRFEPWDAFTTNVGSTKKIKGFTTIFTSERRLFSENQSFSFLSIIIYVGIILLGLGFLKMRDNYKAQHPEPPRSKFSYLESARPVTLTTDLDNMIKRAEQSGNADDLYSIGCTYELEWCKQAENVKSKKELNRLRDESRRKAIKWYRKAAEQGHANAQDKLGYCYYMGVKGVPVYHLAVKWWKKAAEQGNQYAQNSLAICYAKGKGVRQDDDEAVRLWKKAAEMGNSAAEANLKIHKEGNAYLKEQVWKQKELTLQKSYRESSRNFSLKSTFMENKKAAEQGDAQAQYNLGQYYEIGVDVDEDEKTAFEWYGKAAKQGLVEAQDALGRCYHNGIGVERNDEKAVEWWLKAAGQGNVEAQNSLGICCVMGRGVEQDDEEAVKWWQKAIEQGNEAAQENLNLYEKKKIICTDFLLFCSFAR